MSSGSDNHSTAEESWDFPDDIYINTSRNLYEEEFVKRDGSAGPSEGVDEPVTANSNNESFTFWKDSNPKSSCRSEDYPEGIESIPVGSVNECFSFQMDKNNTIISSGEDSVPVKKDNTADEPRYQHNYKTYRTRLFTAICEGDLNIIDALLQKIEESNGWLSHQNLKDPNTGQTCLMKALLKITNKTEELDQDIKMEEIVKKLISFSKKTGDLKVFINAAYTDKIYRGQTSLHIAVERRRYDLVKFLVKNGAAVHAMAKGSFFRNKKHKQCSFYFGGFPLSLAACTNQLDIVTFLIDHGADPWAQDRVGNTVLHALVSIAYDTEDSRSFVTEMYDFILMKSTDMEPSVNLETITNREGLTPLHLAAHTGKIGIFKHILGREIKQKKYKHLSRKFTEWEYGPVSCSLYDLSGVDTIEENSVLQTIVYSSRNMNRHEMLCVEPMNELLQKKWEDFGAFLFIASFLFYLTYIITLTFVASYRLERSKALDQEDCPSVREYTLPISILSYLPWHFQAQDYILLTAVYFLIREATEMMYLRRSNLQSVLMDGFFHVLYFLQSVIVIVFNTLCWAEVEGSRILLVLALALGWFNVLYYTRGFKLTGIYCVMIKKIILQDILRFLLVYAVFIVGFAAALASLIEECPPGSDCPYDGFSSAILELFKLTIGLGDLGIQKYSRFPFFFHTLLVLYVILTFVLLLNMLIALMGETVTKISNESEKIWKLQRAETTLQFERTLPKWLRARCKNGHSFTEVTVGVTPDGREDKRCCLRLNEVNWNEWGTRIETSTESIDGQ
ncbi:transient receptor potential cation channel subfamily V member 3-like isoform X3 [Scyliorhinus canicula]|uniref:transient receptor potential cation channel subfamily V member 3-like isoform X3 n=1 Tax=Scyliorhinus canicula TaxID=7830 RepID=UPI0018F4916A|nr:transient receptor potential cation channel subfamily V member 3-like isoform X3 [Scyliorhinus canicula]